jgi:hypothetical protein
MVFRAQVKTRGLDANLRIQPAESSFVNLDNLKSVDIPVFPVLPTVIPNAIKTAHSLTALKFMAPADFSPDWSRSAGNLSLLGISGGRVTYPLDSMHPTKTSSF